MYIFSLLISLTHILVLTYYEYVSNCRLIIKVVDLYLTYNKWFMNINILDLYNVLN